MNNKPIAILFGGLIIDINTLERIQLCATKYILQLTINKDQLNFGNLLSLMYQYEISDILFLITKSLKNPSSYQTPLPSQGPPDLPKPTK